MMKYFILFGPPGAGKGTQATAMAEKFNLCHISTGALLREEIKAETELGKIAAGLINEGKLVPNELVVSMMASYFEKVNGVDGFLLDGFPRTVEQAISLDNLLAERGEAVSNVLSIMIPDEMIVERIQGRAAVEGRADDADISIIRQRIATYHSQTEPLIEYYQEKGLYKEVDGTGSIEQVREAIFAIL
jgi:adenylate kinase